MHNLGDRRRPNATLLLKHRGGQIDRAQVVGAGLDGYLETASIQSRLYFVDADGGRSVPFKDLFNTSSIKTKADSLKIELKETHRRYYCVQNLDVSSSSNFKSDMTAFYNFVERLTNTLKRASSVSLAHHAI